MPVISVPFQNQQNILGVGTLLCCVLQICVIDQIKLLTETL